MEKFKARGRGRGGADAALRGTRGGGVGRVRGGGIRGSGASAACHHSGISAQRHFSSVAANAAQVTPYWTGRRQQQSMPPPPPPPQRQQMQQRRFGPDKPWQQPAPSTISGQPRGRGRGRGGTGARGRAGKTRYGSGGVGSIGVQTRRRAAAATQSSSSNDPLNLRWVMAESQRREQAGLSPMPGDSAFNSPSALPAAAAEDAEAAEAEAIDDEDDSVEVDEAHATGEHDADGCISDSIDDSAAATSAEAVNEPNAATSPMGRDSTAGTNSVASSNVATSAANDASTVSMPPIPTTPTSATTVSTPTTPLTPSQQGTGSSPFAGGGSGGGHFIPMYGNYRANYGRQMRAGELNIGQMQDDRLQLLQPDWYTDKDVLDIGCNDGVFSLKIAEALGVRSLTGIDIDEELVQTAERNLQTRRREADEEARVKLNLRREGFQGANTNDAASAPASSVQKTGFPYNVKFEVSNFVLDSEAQLAKVEENKYDIIQAFSITKWIHLNWGDKGLKLFFRRAFRQLKPDGKFIVEPQPYQSYKRTLLCPAHKQNYACNIALKPDQFKQFLEREVGFAHILSVWEQQQHHGFQRPVLMCSKPTGQTPALCRDASQHNFRLFVPSHPLRSQLDPSPYCGPEATDGFYLDGGGATDGDLMEADEDQEAAAAAADAAMKIEAESGTTGSGDAAAVDVKMKTEADSAAGSETPLKVEAEAETKIETHMKIEPKAETKDEAVMRQ